MSALGAWQAKLPRNFSLKLAIDYTLADAATLYTVPDGQIMFIERTFWEITTQFAGGSSSAIGVSSDLSGYSTKGDLLGGSGGDVTASLAAGYKKGTIGAAFGSNGIAVITAGKVLRFDRITSVYTSGAGFVHVLGRVIE